MPSGDPRSYVKSVPLPISSQKGIKIQARSDKVFNPRIPTREDVWRWNYQRRQQQMTDQGFYSHNFLPYKGLGDPVYLDVKKMVLHSLGQENESESSSSSEEEEEEKPSAAPLFKASLVAAKFVLRRTKKDLNTLNKEMVKGRSMIRNVQLGHSLFYMIKQERLNKKAARDEEMRRKLELARTQWQPPKGSSSEDETNSDDDDLGKLDNLDNFLGVDGLIIDDSDVNPGGFATEDHKNRLDPSRSLAVSAKSDLSLRKKKKKKRPVPPRPYTPMHTNLTVVTADKEDISSPALFRQLCVLNWILDAMNVDQQNMTMKPISTCWRLNEQDIGGYKIPNKKLREDKKTDSEWEKFLNTKTKKESVTKYSRLSRPSRLMFQPRPSVQLSPSNSISQVNAVEQNSDNQGDIQPAGESMPEAQQESDEDEALYKTSVFKFLDEYYDSLRHQAELEEEKQRTLGTGGDVTLEQGQINQQDSGYHKHRHKDGSDRKKKKSEKHADLDQQDENSKSRSSQPNSQKALVLSEKCQNEQQRLNANKPSHRYEYLTSELRLKFKEVQEERAMSLHDVLDQLDRERFTKCQNKFSSLPTSSVSFHRAVEEMRRRGRKMSIRPDDVRRQSSFKGDWYSDLVNSLPYELKDLWYYKTVLHKLSKYGLMETTSKQSVLKFLKVLEGLRTWEICHPDISAAIEFCRSKIIDMTIDEYELWFSTSFPQVHRPKTAPAGTTSGGMGSKLAGFVSSKKASEGDNKHNVNLRVNSRADSFVSVANGSQGHVRMVQSAVIKRK